MPVADVVQAVAQLLWADAGFKAASPGGVADTQLPEGAALTATTFRDVGGATDPTLDTGGMQRKRIEFACRSTSPAGARTARSALIAVLDGAGDVALADGTFLQNAQLINPGETWFDDDSRQWRATCEFYLIFAFQA